MKLREKETTEERIYRENVVLNETKKQTPIMIFILLGMVVVLTLMWLTSNSLEVKQYGVGDPYHCVECKKLQFACKEHRGYDVKAEIAKEVDTFCNNYSYESIDTSGTYFLYGEGHNFNTNCDFCLSEKQECYGCNYERMTIETVAKEVIKDEVFQTKLCDSCWELKYAQCSSCRLMLAHEMKKKLDLEV